MDPNIQGDFQICFSVLLIQIFFYKIFTNCRDIRVRGSSILIPFYFHQLQRHLSISRVITSERLLPCVACDRTRVDRLPSAVYISIRMSTRDLKHRIRAEFKVIGVDLNQSRIQKLEPIKTLQGSPWHDIRHGAFYNLKMYYISFESDVRHKKF